MLSPMGTPGLTPGVHRWVRLPDPAPGADWQFKFACGGWTKLVMVHARLDTSAVVAGRAPIFALADADNAFAFESTPIVGNVAASSNNTVSLVSAGGPMIAGAAGKTNGGLPDVWLPDGWSFRVSTFAIDVADQWTRIGLYVYELNPDENYPAGRLDEFVPNAEPLG